MNKRKRESQDTASARAAPATNQMGNEFEHHYLQTADDGGIDFAAAFGQSNDNTDGQTSDQLHTQGGDDSNENDTAAAAIAFHQMTVPQATEEAFANLPTDYDVVKAGSANQDSAAAAQDTSTLTENIQSSPDKEDSKQNGPAVGSDEWHKRRKDNHKEVERRRRETINEGISELSAIVPGCEKNKGSVLARAVQFIKQLKENETQNIEKWTLEKLLTEQAIAELSGSCDKLKTECQRAWKECEQWKQAAQKAGVSIPNADGGEGGDEAE
ncbi:hypothetical protein BDY17DRAFT_258145 [Neohortaea acidophila]|uniref:BHLH domain-containing protein n=1 Tax=Neohortaea acidophila TaxID=245834 RepID=A0A6A6PG27_9PEZI|nr:uncharacterized protein BDY17DRAFT_258145 [Neohortaea acidophila]KAF2478684.1 hypothetical protein BDY17DRAFT_258145 [Neohortaea acidophila]